MPFEAVHDTARTPICETSAEYVATLPACGGEPLAHATETYCPDSSFYELLQQKNTNILLASDGGHKDVYGSFGWVVGTKDEVIWDHEGVARGYPIQSYRAKSYGRMSLVLFLPHYIRFYNIKPSAGLRVTSYCDSSSLLKVIEKAFHTKDVHSSTWYLKSDHDVIIALTEVRKGLPFKVILRHVKSHQDDERAFVDRLHSISFVRRGKPQRSTYFLSVGAIYVTATASISPVVKYAHSEPHSLRTSFETICNTATTGQTRPTTPSTGLLIALPVPDSLTTPEHS
jgi:hypothetical protein